MNIYPAIDIKNGNCVRLVQGDFNQETIFNNSPSDQAKKFSEAGFEWLHVVDLDGATKAKPMNMEIIQDLTKNSNLKVQVGGGIRDIKVIEEYFDNGVHRVIVGTAAINNFEMLVTACKEYPSRIVVGIDVRSNKISVEGWLEDSDVMVFDLISKLQDIGVAAIIYTDINKDGKLSGFDEVGATEIAKSCSIPLIISGGVSTVDDIEKISKMSSYGIDGAIIGRAFYEGKISYEDALAYSGING